MDSSKTTLENQEALDCFRWKFVFDKSHPKSIFREEVALVLREVVLPGGMRPAVPERTDCQWRDEAQRHTIKNSEKLEASSTIFQGAVLY